PASRWRRPLSLPDARPIFATAGYRFELPASVAPGTPIDVSARLVWRRVWRSFAVTKGWTTDVRGGPIEVELHRVDLALPFEPIPDRKSTRLNSSHVKISYA